MSTYSEIDEEKLSLSDMPDELLTKVRRSVGLLGNSQKGDLYHGQGSEKRSRREIANCNERRRMQSINSGFESLKTLLPTEDGEKLSKAAILQLTSKYIQHLVGENRRMRDQLSQIQQQQQPQQQQPQQQQQQQQPRQTDLLLAASDVALRKRKLPAAPDDGDGGVSGGGGGVYIGYFQQQGNHAVIRAQQQQQQQQQPTFQLAVKPDYEQFVIEPAVQQQQQPLPAKPKRLEHLMMAIERIEGQSTQQQQQQQQQQHQQPAVMISPFTPHDTQPTDDNDHHSAKSGTIGNDTIDRDSASSPRIVVVDLASAAAAAAAAAATPENSSVVVCSSGGGGSSSVAESSSADSPSGAESPGLCRPRAIPHKYLHRPQVVQANSSN